MFTETAVLAGLGITGANDDARTDAAREAGILYVCLGCGSVGQATDGRTVAQYYADAANVRAAREWVADIAECCGEAHSVMY